jgi:IS1 family transposase
LTVNDIQSHDTIGKSRTTAIEQDNSNTRHYLARMTRRTKVVSKSDLIRRLFQEV